jgi:multidrug efflux pump subunit AcrA (membrane-fusion protein)
MHQGGKVVGKRNKLWIVLGVVALIIILAIFFFMKQKGTSPVDGSAEMEMDVLVQKVTEETLDETILVTGKIVPEDEQKIYADPEHGEIKEFFVKENGKVKKGDPLFAYDEATLNREFDAAVRGREMTENNVASIQNQINQLANQKENMKKNRTETITIEKEVDGEMVEETKEEQVVSEEDINQVQIEINQLALELENAKADVASAQAEINAIDEQRAALTVTSKISGTIVKLNKNLEKSEEGATEPVVHIISGKPFKVIGTMSEFDAVKIKKEQPVDIIPKVYKDRIFTGEVESVSQHPTDDGMEGMDMGGDSNVTMYPFTVKITDDTKELRQGFHVSLEVSVGGNEKSMVVPHAAMMDDMMMGEEEEDFSMMDEMFGSGGFDMGDDTSFVYVLVDGMLERRDIETGKMNDEFVEIISGVELGELVVISPMMEMYDGMEVTSYDEVE